MQKQFAFFYLLLLFFSFLEMSSSENISADITEDDASARVLLPQPAEDVEAILGTEKPQTLELDGDKLDLDELGPMIINPDGTVRRIANWDVLTEREKQVAWRRIAERNKRRIAELEEAGSSADTTGVDEVLAVTDA